MTYRETFFVGGTEYGIEDTHGPGTHYFSSCTDRMKKRFYLWRGGCVVGEADTMDQARENIWAYAHRDRRDRVSELKRLLVEAERDVERLGDDYFNLGRFML